MKQATESQWTPQEKEIARVALANAYSREIQTVVQVVQQQAHEVKSIEEVWQLNDFLSARRFDLDGKYDDREAESLFVLAQLTKDGWLHSQDLVGLEPEKLAKIAALTRIL